MRGFAREVQQQTVHQVESWGEVEMKVCVGQEGVTVELEIKVKRGRRRSVLAFVKMRKERASE